MLTRTILDYLRYFLEEKSQREKLMLLLIINTIKQDSAFVCDMPLRPTLESDRFTLKEATLLTFEQQMLADLENLIFIRYKAWEYPTPKSKKAIPTDRLGHFPVEGSFTLKFVRESADEMLSLQRQDALAQFMIEGRLANPFQEKRAVLEVVTIGERTYSQLRRVMVDDRPLEFEAQECKMQKSR